MRSPSEKYIERKIARFNRDLQKIDEVFYPFGANEGDREAVSYMLERKRDNLIRAGVLQLHTAIEDLLNQYLMHSILKGKKPQSDRGKALQRMLYGAGSLGFDMKLNFAVTLGLISATLREKLMELNTIRNKCSHNWILNARVRRGRRPRQTKPPLLYFRGLDLHNIDHLRDFFDEYAAIYLRLSERTNG